MCLAHIAQTTLNHGVFYFNNIYEGTLFVCLRCSVKLSFYLLKKILLLAYINFLDTHLPVAGAEVVLLVWAPRK